MQAMVTLVECTHASIRMRSRFVRATAARCFAEVLERVGQLFRVGRPPDRTQRQIPHSGRGLCSATSRLVSICNDVHGISQVSMTGISGDAASIAGLADGLEEVRPLRDIAVQRRDRDDLNLLSLQVVVEIVAEAQRDGHHRRRSGSRGRVIIPFD